MFLPTCPSEPEVFREMIEILERDVLFFFSSSPSASGKKVEPLLAGSSFSFSNVLDFQDGAPAFHFGRLPLPPRRRSTRLDTTLLPHPARSGPVRTIHPVQFSFSPPSSPIAFYRVISPPSPFKHNLHYCWASRAASSIFFSPRG